MSKHTHDRTFFDVLNPINCYWAGFIAADGYIGRYGNITIGLSYRDREHLINFKKAIQQTSNVRDFITSNSYKASQINIYGAYECQNALRNIYNITQAKSLTLYPPFLKEENHIRHFIRGYMDGDGCVSFNKKRKVWALSFLGTKLMLEWIKDQIQKNVLQVGNPSIGKDRGIYQLIFSCWQVRPILEWLYKDSTCDIRLERKYKKYLEILNFYPAEKRKYASKYRGVAFFKRINKWKAEIKHDNQRYHLGYFNTEQEAAIAYNNKAYELGLKNRCYAI